MNQNKVHTIVGPFIGLSLETLKFVSYEVYLTHTSITNEIEIIQSPKNTNHSNILKNISNCLSVSATIVEHWLTQFHLQACFKREVMQLGSLNTLQVVMATTLKINID